MFGIRRAALAVIGSLALASFGAGSGEDYVRDVSPSAAARAYFAAVPKKEWTHYASEHRREFKASEFAAQVGNGKTAGSCRQRVTMVPPDEFIVVMGAAQEGVEVDQEVSIGEIEGAVQTSRRQRTARRRSARTRQERCETESKRERTKRERKSETTTVMEVPPVPPVPPIREIITETVTNEVVRSVMETLNVRVVSLTYDSETHTGILTAEIISGSFKEVKKYLRTNLDKLIRENADKATQTNIPQLKNPHCLMASMERKVLIS